MNLTNWSDFTLDIFGQMLEIQNNFNLSLFCVTERFIFGFGRCYNRNKLVSIEIHRIVHSVFFSFTWLFPFAAMFHLPNDCVSEKGDTPRSNEFIDFSKGKEMIVKYPHSSSNNSINAVCVCFCTKLVLFSWKQFFISTLILVSTERHTSKNQRIPITKFI